MQRLGLAIAFAVTFAAASSCNGDILAPLGPQPDATSPSGPQPADLPIAKPGEAGVNALLFVTQVPQAPSFSSIGTVFGNHLPQIANAPRGGDLWIRYPEGTLRNLTEEAGFGNAGMQLGNAIAVRQPAPHWSGTKAIFSMVVGAPLKQYEQREFRWQLYEVTGLAQGAKATITKVAKQPETYNNLSPIYGTDDRIIFTSDRPRDGQPHLYPQLDEYESAATNTGIYSLDSTSGDIKLLDHAPSGDFDPTIDSVGRVVFSRWDHLMRDQQNDDTSNKYGCFNYSDESASSKKTSSRTEIFPEPRTKRTDLLAGTNLVGHAMNLFMPWQMNEDGTELETLNHIGRHELNRYFTPVFKDDPALIDFVSETSKRTNTNFIETVHQLREDPKQPGRFLFIEAPEFGTAAAGMIAAMALPDKAAADGVVVEYITDPSTRELTPSKPMGHYRSPTPLTDGSLVATYSPSSEQEGLVTTGGIKRSNYGFRLVTLKKNGTYYAPGAKLTDGITKSIEYWAPDQKVSFTGELWELDPVEIYARTVPARHTTPVPAPESNVFNSTEVNVADFQKWMADRNLALLVSRNVTVRDFLDKQQPYNLKVANGTAETVTSGKTYTISQLQFVQGDLIRGITDSSGRRVLAQLLHDTAATSANGPSAIAGAVTVQSDGSVAAFVPARRALSWQLTDTAGTPVIRERYWVTFQPGEVRVCAVCHGLSSKDQKGRELPTNEPEALRKVLQQWKTVK